jgi:molybdopterin-guanine dinucleotide biosynthesis protein B
VATPRIISVIGRKDAGKTTLVVALASEFIRKGRRVMTIKHADQPVDVDRAGTDSYVQFHEGKAERTLLVGPNMRVLFDRQTKNDDAVALTRQYLEGADIVLAEGVRQPGLPKIEVFRRGPGLTPLFQPTLPDASDWIGIITDDDHLEASCPVLRFRDTMWLQLLATMAWEKARQL